jgi:sarcosine oxidase/L-pipecolate oxidase
LVKVAIHGAGYTNKVASDAAGVSVPRTKLTKGAEDGAIPKEMVDELRKGLRDIFPELAEKDFEGTRLCWYVISSFAFFGWDWLIS